ncbi:hypothetical protein PH210_09650 [Paenibacillus sp. BSR1-1]|uniref:hypothetical protein n=1 Tax=Paenibacillus sp. BSR1-1 TaxID=3020845 RepID=UPI0025B1620F|nr:hypothetical protein [Paenibacillus sp. BSR1-1]MDN3016466.1 hypothetical protein [Paenibacillus sp. BSR1-1]
MKALHYKNTIIGLSILGIVLILSLLYPLYGPEDFNKVMYLYDKKGNLIGVPPIPPSSHYFLGSDRNGADILLMMIYGAKFTLLSAFGVTFIRVLIGGALGIIFSLWLKRLLPILKDFLLVFNLVPPIIITLVLMFPVSTTYIEDSVYSILFYQIIILIIMGVPSVLIMTTEIIDEMKGKSFIQCSYLMGGNHFHVLKTHLKPFLTSYGFLMAIQHLLNTLVLIMYLGAFQVYLGGVSREEVRGLPILNSISKEWAGLIGQNYREFFMSPWVVLIPLTCYFLLIIIINMIKKEIEVSLDINSHGMTFKRRKKKKQNDAVRKII